jgi:ribose transport system substrate-binding protein
MKSTIIRLLSALMLTCGLCSIFSAQEKIKIVIIPKSGEALFWKATHAGAKFGTMGLNGVEISWRAPQSESDSKQQIDIIDKCVSEGVSGVILSPISYDAPINAVSNVMKKKIPVLIFDSALKGTPGKDFICFVGIDNKKAGKTAGDHLANLLNGKGKVVLLRHIKGQANTAEREEGFLDAISEYPNIRVIEKDHYGGGTSDEAKKVSKNMLSQLKEADGVFCPNETTTLGMLYALREANMAGKIEFVGFDTPAIVIEALEKGEISAVIGQDPSRMGYESVKTIVDYIHGKTIPSTIDIGVHIITRKNLNDPDIKKLLALPSIVE